MSGCSVPLEYLYNAGNGEKDVSGKFERGHVVGKEYELLQDVYLKQFRDSEKLDLDTIACRTYILKNGEFVEDNKYAILEIVPKGSKFRVCSVLVKTIYGSELCSQNIIGNFIDDNGDILIKMNSFRKIAQITVSNLFKNTFQASGEDWVFHPDPRWIKEINAL
jgi:hypothetical protein